MGKAKNDRAPVFCLVQSRGAVLFVCGQGQGTAATCKKAVISGVHHLSLW